MAKGHSPATIHSRQSAMALTMPMRHSPRQAKIPAMHETMHPISRWGDSLKKNRCVLGGHGHGIFLCLHAVGAAVLGQSHAGLALVLVPPRQELGT